MTEPMEIDWQVGVNGIDGYTGSEVQGPTTSQWFFLSSNDQGDSAPQTFTILVPQVDGPVTLRPWWIGLKDNITGIKCNAWDGTAVVSLGVSVVSFDATCQTQNIRAVGTVTRHP